MMCTILTFHEVRIRIWITQAIHPFGYIFYFVAHSKCEIHTWQQVGHAALITGLILLRNLCSLPMPVNRYDGDKSYVSKLVSSLRVLFLPMISLLTSLARFLVLFTVSSHIHSAGTRTMLTVYSESDSMGVMKISKEIFSRSSDVYISL